MVVIIAQLLENYWLLLQFILIEYKYYFLYTRKSSLGGYHPLRPP
jgi:hypothetical protein